MNSNRNFRNLWHNVSSHSDRCFHYFTAAMFVPLRRKQTWRLETNLYNLSDTLLQITREWKAAETWLLARLSIYQSSIVSQIRDFIHWMVTSFSSDLMTGESQKSFEWSYAAKASQYVSLTNLQSAQPSSLIRRHSWGSVTWSKPKGTFLALCIVYSLPDQKLLWNQSASACCKIKS